jgi:hypothetical protein
MKYHPRPGVSGPLDAVRLKLHRAQEHANVLRSEIEAFLWREPHGSRAEIDADANELLVRAFVREQPPASWGPILGDFVHNLRSALDHLAIALVLSNDPRADITRNSFPLFENDPNREDATAEERKRWKRLTKGMTAEQIAEIERYQPFNYPVDPGNVSTLTALGNLSNIDKHRGLIALGHFGHIVQIIGFDTPGWHVVEQLEVAPPQQLEHDAVIARFKAIPAEENPGKDAKVRLVVKTGVTLLEGVPPSTPLDELLQGATVYVLDLVNAFNAQFFRD